MSQNPKLELGKWIRTYFALGIECFPCRLFVQDGKKRYSGPHWKQCISEEMALSMVEANHNTVALKTGEKSNLFVLDIDVNDKANGFDTLKELGVELNGTPCAQTQSGGKHYFFAFCPELPRNKSRKKAGLDTRGDGGLIYAPPSHVEGGGQYSWLKHITRPLPPLPGRLVAFFNDNPVAASLSAPATPKCLRRIDELSQAQRDWLFRDIQACADENGDRSYADHRACCTAIKLGISADDMFHQLQGIGKVKQRGRPYFDTTWSSAEKAVPYDDRWLYRAENKMPELTEATPREEQAQAQSNGNARKVRLVGVDDFRDSIYNLWENGTRSTGTSTGWLSLDYLYRVNKGHLNVWTGYPSHGKSALMDAMCVNLSRIEGWRWMYFSPENFPFNVHFQKLAELYVGASMIYSKNKMSRSELDGAYQFVRDHFVFVDLSEDMPTITDILAACEAEMGQRCVDGLVIDPWNELETLAPKGMNKTDFIGHCLSRTRRFARRMGIGAWIIAHPAKVQRDHKTGSIRRPHLSDISDSAHWWNKADDGIVVWRTDKGAQIYVDKIKLRHQGKMGESVELGFDWTSGRFYDLDQSQDGRSDHGF